MNQQATAAAPEWEGFRLSRQQEHVLDRTSGESANRIVAGVTLATAVDRDVLEQAIRDVALVHESLRTAYRGVLGENSAVLMVIDDEPRIQVSERAGDDAALAAIVRAEAHADLGEDDRYALRLILFTHSGQQRSLVVSAPRASMDVTSIEVFFRDLGQAYASRAKGTAWHREDVLQYADYAQWQSEEGIPNERHKAAVAEREARLAELPPVYLPLELRSVETRHETVEWTVPAAVAAKLRGLAGEVDGGLQTVLLTGWLVALWHATGRPESLAVTSMLTRRPFDEMAGSIGLFESPMPMIAEVLDETTLGDLARTVGRKLDSLERADEGVMDTARQHDRGLPGFRFSDVTGFTAGDVFSDLWIEPGDDDRKVALLTQAVDDRIRLTLRYQAGGMAEGGPEALVTCLRAALSALCDDPAQLVGSLPVLDEEAARELVAATNNTQPAGQPPAHWYRHVERIARRTPEATAIRFAGRTWTYRELDRAANRLANELVGRGVAMGDLVGLCLERSDLAIVAMLAIAKAGAGYVPVDPSLPVKRRSAIISGSGLSHAVATDETAGVLPAGCDVVLVDADLTVCRDRSDERPDVVTTDDSPAYVLFTSGSTGTPKGVLVGHGQLAAYLDGVADRLGLAGPVSSVALGTLGTDLGNTALFPTLISGGELLVVAPEVSSDAQALAELLAQESYDLIKMTPSHLDAVLSVAEDPKALMPRQALVVGGEPFGWGEYRSVQPFLGDCALFNHYGPTETTVGVLCGQVLSEEMAKLASTVPVGKPMRHARAYVLDPQRRPLPAGLVGELWIGGSSVSQGYLPGTADQNDRFVDDPFTPVRGARMYRSGDKARILPDGTVEILGRIDRQLKVRGFRVELGEIEAVMRQHPRVTSSLVVEKGKVSQAQLVGYLTDAEGSRGSADWLRDFLAERLPGFMIPNHLVALDAFPLTSTGKIDATMLPEPGFYGLESASYVEPRTPTEKKVAEVMARLLLLRRVGIEDDFFEIGGHSLLATQLIARLRDEFRVDIKLRNLFERPVVSELAEFVDELLAKVEEQA